MNTGNPNDIRLSVVIPTYNKASRIAASLETVLSYLAAKPFTAEIVVVDDGSSDGTADAARAALAGRYPSPGHRAGTEPGQGRLGPGGRAGRGRRGDPVLRRRPVDAHRRARQGPGRARSRGRRRHRLAGPAGLRHPGPPAVAARMDGQGVQPARAALRPEGLSRHPVRLQGLPPRAGEGHLREPPDPGVRLRRRGPGPLPRCAATASPRSRSPGATSGRAASGCSRAPGA